MKSMISAALFCGLMIASTPAAMAATTGAYSMEVLMDGRPMREYDARSTTYIEARKGREYSVRLTNHTGERVAVALSIDGLNSIDAKHTSAAAARKWILQPYETMVVGGWQTSSATARKFYFTDEQSSYGSWLGDTRNLGNISAAFFREVRPEPPRYVEPQGWYGYDEDGRGAAADRARPSGAPRAGAPAAPMAESAAPAMKGEARKSSASNSLAATGIGREQRNQVYSVEFRQESAPSGVVTMRYEYRKELVRLGVIPKPPRPDALDRREQSGGFTDAGFAPDPYQARVRY